LESDLFSAVEGRTFDRIVTHLPHVPSLTPIALYRDGGETGETLVQKTVKQLPVFLRGGGTFIALCAGLDNAEGLFEERARSWLGAIHKEFDILLVRKSQCTPQEFVQDLMWAQQKMDPAEVLKWESVFNKSGAYNMPYGALIIHRRQAGNLPPWTARAAMSALTNGSRIEWVLGWRHCCVQPNAEEFLARLKPHLSPRLQMRVTHAIREGRLVPTEFLCISDDPFFAEAQVEPSMMSILSQFDGKKTVAELFQAAQAQALVPQGYELPVFARLISIFIERGYLSVEDEQG
jgi:hypothetical protein